jgi:hypothetical protein
LKALQARLEHYEKLAEASLEGEPNKKCWEQIAYYRGEVSRVRTAVLELHSAAIKELKR